MQKVGTMPDFSNKDQMAKQPKPQNKASRRLPGGKIASREATWLPQRAIKGPNRPKWPVGDPKLRPEASAQKGENWSEKARAGGQRSKNGKGDFKGGKATGQGFRQRRQGQNTGKNGQNGNCNSPTGTGQERTTDKAAAATEAKKQTANGNGR
jgi:hypothetical protein